MADQDGQERKLKLQTVIDRAIEAFAARLPKAMPARVTKYEADKQRVTCKILVQQPYVDEEDARQVESLPAVPGVPVRFDGGGGFRSTYPISDGNLILGTTRVPATTGLLVFCDRSLDKWLTGSGAEVDPEFDHQHALADAVFFPGLNPFGAPLAHVPTDKMSIGRDASPSDIEIDSQGNINVAGGGAAAARAGDPCMLGSPTGLPPSAMAIWMAAVETAINGLAPGAITPLSGSFLTTPGISVKTGSTKVQIG